MTDVVALGWGNHTYAVVNSCIGQEVLTLDVKRNSQYKYDNQLYKLTSEDAKTVYYMNIGAFSEELHSTIQTIILSPKRSKVVLCVFLQIENGSIMKGKSRYGEQIDFSNAYLNSFGTYSIVVLLNKVNTSKYYSNVKVYKSSRIQYCYSILIYLIVGRRDSSAFYSS